jgi:3'-5' exoribonuclease
MVPRVSATESVETVRKIYARDVKEKERLETVFRVSAKARQLARSGKPFLSVTLADRTGLLEARVFDAVDTMEPAFQMGDYVLVSGHVVSFHGKPQLVIESLARLDPEPIDPAEFTPPEPDAVAPAPETKSGRDVDSKGAGAVRQIRELVERVQDSHVRSLLLSFLDDPDIARGLPVAPAAKGIHHAYPGGLAEHLLSVMRLAHRAADHYPMLDRDLLVAGALLHDIGKVQELSYEKGTEYTDEGRLVGHLVMTAQRIHAFAQRLPGFPPLLEHHITHLVLAHHGELAYGSPKEPATLEAYVVHALDTLDSRVSSWLDLMARDPNERWTDRTKLYDRHLWKGPVPTVRNRSPVEPRRKRSRGGRGGHPSAAERPSLPAEVTFKPLEALAPAAPASEATPPLPDR